MHVTYKRSNVIQGNDILMMRFFVVLCLKLKQYTVNEHLDAVHAAESTRLDEYVNVLRAFLSKTK